MIRYLRLYGYFLRFSFSKALQFRVDFYFRVVMDSAWYLVNLAFFAVLYEHTSLLGGWSYDQVLIFAAGLFLVDAVGMTLFSNNAWWFPFLINKGDLDYYLVRPVSTLFFLSVREFAANSFLNLLIACGIMVWALTRYPGDLGAVPILLYIVLLLVGAFLHYSLHFCFLIPVFWLHSAHGLREIFYSLDRYSSRPHDMFQGWVRRLLLSVLPLALIVSVPAQILFEGPTLVTITLMAVVPGLFFLLLLFLWRAGLRSYSSASS